MVGVGRILDCVNVGLHRGSIPERGNRGSVVMGWPAKRGLRRREPVQQSVLVSSSIGAVAGFGREVRGSVGCGTRTPARPGSLGR